GGVGNFYFVVRDGASFEMSNSTLTYCGYEHTDYRYTGLYLECDASIEYSTIDHCEQGIMAENRTVTIKHTTIEHSSGYNLKGHKATMTIDHCTFNATSGKSNVEFSDECTVTFTHNTVSYAAHNGIWADDSCDLTLTNNFIHNNTRSGLWINDSDVVCNTNTISDNGKTDAPTWDESGHGFAGFHGDVTFKNNLVGYNFGHNFETTNCTAVFEDNTFYRSIMKCNVEFFEGSVVTAKNNYIDGAGHNCFWVRDGVTATIENNIMKNSPHNGIWAGNGCTMIIRNNEIENCAESGIYSYNSTLTIENNEITNCTWWGIQTEGCTVTQSGNSFTDVDLGEISYQYFIKLKVKDKDDAAVSGATVRIKDSGGNVLYTTTTDANGETSDMLFTGFKQDAGGATTTPSYTVEVEKDGMSTSSVETFDQTETISMSLAAEEDGEDEDGDFTLMIIIIVVIVIVVLVIAMVAMKKKKT
ncbi:MAG: right-handed parallel beta-helix repeat-containing protein, partial [Thermoplasmata archaeon]